MLSFTGLLYLGRTYIHATLGGESLGCRPTPGLQSRLSVQCTCVPDNADKYLDRKTVTILAVNIS